MNDFDEKGWAPIHHAVYRGFVRSIERFVKAGAEQLELLTKDELKCTPFLVATTAGNLETIGQMMSLNCNISAVDTQSHGAIEIATLRLHVNVLDYFLSLNNPALPVLDCLVKMVQSSEDESLASTKCLKILTSDTRSDALRIIETLLEPRYRLVMTIHTVLTDLSSGSVINCDQILYEICELLFNLFAHYPSVIDDCERGGYLSVILSFFKADVVRMRAAQAHLVRLLNRFIRSREHAEVLMRQNVIPAMLRMLKHNNKDSSAVAIDQLLLDVLTLLANVASFGTEMQTEICRDTDLVRFLVEVYRTSRQKETILALTSAVCALIRSHKQNQSLLLQLGVADAVLECLRLKSIDVQTAAVDALYLLCTDNTEVQELFKAKNVYVPLLALLKRSRVPQVHKKILNSLWQLAGHDLNEQQLVAKLVGVMPLYSYLSSPDETLRFVSMKMITALALAPICTRHEVTNLNGVQTLIGHLDTDNRELLLQVLRTVRQLSIGVAYIANRAVQDTIDRVRGTLQLMSIMQRAAAGSDFKIYLETAFTLSALCLNNRPIMLEVRSVTDFTFSRLLHILADIHGSQAEPERSDLRFLAGATLAAFLYGSLREQAIASIEASLADAPLRFRYFIDSLKHTDLHRRIEAAFQIVVMCKVIADEVFPITSAAGIKILSDALESSLKASNEALVFHALETIARLLRLRSAGISEAFIAVGIVDVLVKLLLPELVTVSGRRDKLSADLPSIFGFSNSKLFSENVRGAAAISLTFLSYFAEGRSRMMTYCRRFPQLVPIIKHYVHPVLSFSKTFQEAWFVYASQLLPEVKRHAKVNMVAFSPVDLAMEKVKELSYLSLARDDSLAFEDTSASAPPMMRSQRTILPQIAVAIPVSASFPPPAVASSSPAPEPLTAASPEPHSAAEVADHVTREQAQPVEASES